MRRRLWAWCGIALAAVTGCVSAETTLTHIWRDQLLQTQDAAYCAAPGPVYLKHFDVTYYRMNSSVRFDVDVGTAPNDAQVTVDLHVYAYGRDFLEFKVDLCSIADGALCPLPVYNFSGSGTFNVSREYTSKIPAIAYTVPDLEALAVLHLTDNNSGQKLGCVQTILSSGLTVGHDAIGYSTVSLVAAMTLASLVTTVWTDSVSALQWRIVDLTLMVQHIGKIAMLTLILPKPFMAFARMLTWALGVFRMGPVDDAVSHTLSNTHAKTDADKNSELFDGRLESEYSRLANVYPAVVLNSNQPAMSNLSNILLHNLPTAAEPLAKRKLFAPNTGPGGELDPGGQGSYVTAIPTLNGFLNSGIVRFVEDKHISQFNASLDVIIAWIFVWLVIIGALLIAAPVSMLVWGRERMRDDGAHSWLLRFHIQVVRPTLLRLLYPTTPPVLIFSFFQWAHGTSWALHLIAAVACAALVLTWLVVAVRIGRQAVCHSPESLFYSRETSPWDMSSAAVHIGSLTHQWRPRYWWMPFECLARIFVDACFVGFPQRGNFGMRQSVGLTITEVLFFAVLVLLRPGCDRKENAIQILLSLFRIVSWALCITLTTQVNVFGIPRAVLGFVLLAATALAIVFMFFVFLFEVFMAAFARSQRWSTRIYRSEKPKKQAIYEKEPELDDVSDKYADAQTSHGV